MQELQKIMDETKRQYESCKRKDFLNQKITEKSSYIDRKNGMYLQKMDFDTPLKLQKKLQEIWDEETYMKEFEKIFVVAAFKLRSSDIVLTDTIKEKVYNF